MRHASWAPTPRTGVEVFYDRASRTVVVRFEADDGVPSCTFDVVTSMHATYDEIASAARSGVEIANLVLSSNIGGIFNMGGDLGMMASMARLGDRAGLAEYGRLTAGLVHRTWSGLGSPITTFSAVDGDAFGGGFEAALSANFCVASRASRFAFPETRFGLFPGIGRYEPGWPAGVCQAFSANVIADGRTLTAAEASRDDLLDRVFKDKTEARVLNLLQRVGERGQSQLARLAEMRRHHARYSYEEAMSVVGVWVDAVLAAPERTLTHIERIVKAQKSRLNRGAAKTATT